jgi:TolB protein
MRRPALRCLGLWLVGVVFVGGGWSHRAVAQETAKPAVEADPDAGYTVRLFVAKKDGSEPKPLLNDPAITSQGSPSWSRDGRLIAFDGWGKGVNGSNASIFVVNPDGTNLRKLTAGAMPSFSPRGNRIAFSRYSGKSGIWIMNSDGPETELVQIDESGWGTDWSPDGSRIAYTKHDQAGANIAIVNIVEGTRSMVFQEGSPYRQIYWNFAWSPDSKTIAFKGTTKGGRAEVGVVDAEGADKGLKTVVEGETLPALCFHPDGRLMFSQPFAARGNQLQLLTLFPTKDDPPQLLPGLPPEFVYSDSCTSPDGEWVIYARKKAPPPAK